MEGDGHVSISMANSAWVIGSAIQRRDMRHATGVLIFLLASTAPTRPLDSINIGISGCACVFWGSSLVGFLVAPFSSTTLRPPNDPRKTPARERAGAVPSSRLLPQRIRAKTIQGPYGHGSKACTPNPHENPD